MSLVALDFRFMTEEDHEHQRPRSDPWPLPCRGLVEVLRGAGKGEGAPARITDTQKDALLALTCKRGTKPQKCPFLDTIALAEGP